MRQSQTSSGRQRGIAVVSAILIAALVASLAFALSSRERLWLNQIENRRDLSAAQAVALSAIDLARLTLRDDMRNNPIDHLLETWTVPVPPINVDDGKVAGRLIELQGRFNLFTLQEGGKVNAASLGALKRLLAARGLPADWADKLAAAMARQVETTRSMRASAAGGAAAKLLPAAHLSELAELGGIDAAKLAALEPLVTILPESTPVNVNFATPEVMVAFTPGLSLGEADQIVRRRASAHFRSTRDYVNALPEHLRRNLDSSAYCVESQYFLSDVESWFGRAYVHLNALIYRQRNRAPELVWLRRIGLAGKEKSR